MIRLTNYINHLVNIEIKQGKKGDTSTLSGHITAVGKDYILIVDQDCNEHSYRKEHIKNVKNITKPKKQVINKPIV